MTAHAATIPPAFAGSHWEYLFSLFGLMMVTLLGLEWLWRVSWSFAERPAPLRSPVTAARIIVLLLLIAGLMRGAPDAVLLMQWPELTQGARYTIARVDSLADGAAIIPFSGAWLVDYLAGGVIHYQLRRQPPAPSHLWPTWSSVKRPLKIGVGVGIIAVAITFFQ